MKTYIKTTTELHWNALENCWTTMGADYDLVEAERKPLYTVDGFESKVVTRYAALTAEQVEKLNAMDDEDDRVEYLVSLANEQQDCTDAQMRAMEYYINHR